MVLENKRRSDRHQNQLLPHNGPHKRLKRRCSHKPKNKIRIYDVRRTLWVLVLLSPTFVLLSSISSDAVVRKGYSLQRLPSENESANCILASPTSKEPTYVFLHLHKTGGNNLKLALFGFAKRNKLLLHHTCRPSKGEGALKAWWFNRKKRPGVSTDCNLDDLAWKSRGQRNSYDFIVGHQYFGVHRLLHRRDVNYFTIVRHPLARKVSHYTHFEMQEKAGIALTKTGANSSASVDEREVDQLLLAQYLFKQNRNYMVKRLATSMVSSEIASSCRSWYIDMNPFAAKAALRNAQKHLLNHFFFVGVQERYSESICILACLLNTACYAGKGRVFARKLDSAKIIYSKANSRGATGHRIAALPQSVRAAALRSENLDMELYLFANKLLDSSLQQYPRCGRSGSGNLNRKVKPAFNTP
jgi:hypothetical protein